jgi:hypothetical protein
MSGEGVLSGMQGIRPGETSNRIDVCHNKATRQGISFCEIRMNSAFSLYLSQ